MVGDGFCVGADVPSAFCVLGGWGLRLLCRAASVLHRCTPTEDACYGCCHVFPAVFCAHVFKLHILERVQGAAKSCVMDLTPFAPAIPKTLSHSSHRYFQFPSLPHADLCFVVLSQVYFLVIHLFAVSLFLDLAISLLASFTRRTFAIISHDTNCQPDSKSTSL